MAITDIISTHEAENGFYPTPPELAARMLDGVDWHMVNSVLEPSAGKGDLIMAVAKSYHDHTGHWRSDYGIDVDCIELDPYLREICKYQFSDAHKREVGAQYDDIERKCYADRTAEDKEKMAYWQTQYRTLDCIDLHIVHDDFFTYRSYKNYSLIVMNPPFENGDRHLLKALEMQKDGGSVICLLNAETIRNPYTETRKLLKKKLDEIGASIEFVENAFSQAERRTDVEVAIIKAYIPEKTHESTIWERMQAAAEAEHIPDPELNALVPGGIIEQMTRLYETEVAATMELVKEYRALSPYIMRDMNDGKYNSPILNLTVTDDNYIHGLDMNKYMRTVRLKYWRALFNNDQFTGRLTSKLKEDFRKNVDRMANYEFSAFNIKQVTLEINASIHQGVQDAILDLFEKLTAEHYWHPECAANRHYYNGWATNKAHKIGKKCIIPTNGVFSTYSWEKTFSVNNAYAVLNDIEKALDYLDGGETTDRYNLESFLNHASENGKTRNIECTYFLVDFFKKGTCHIKFRPEAMRLVEKLNIYAAMNKNWLPPNYGKKTYHSMEADERAVVDSFHGDETEGSGEKAYTKILEDRAYYLAGPANQIKALTGATE